MPLVKAPKLKKYRTQNLSDDYFRALFLGSSGSGKTHYLIEEWYKKKLQYEYEKVIVITTKINDSYYRKNIPKAAIFTPEGDANKKIQQIDSLIEDLENALYKHGVKGKDEKGNYIFKYNTLIIFDDIINEKVIHKSKVNEMFCRFRHLQTSIIFLIQTGTRMITTSMKSNATHFALFNMTDQRSRNVQEEQIRNVIWAVPQNATFSHNYIKKVAKLIYRDYILSVPYGRVIIDYPRKQVCY